MFESHHLPVTSSYYWFKTDPSPPFASLINELWHFRTLCSYILWLLSLRRYAGVTALSVTSDCASFFTQRSPTLSHPSLAAWRVNHRASTQVDSELPRESAVNKTHTLRCHSRENTGVIYNINYDSVPLGPSKLKQWHSCIGAVINIYYRAFPARKCFDNIRKTYCLPCSLTSPYGQLTLFYHSRVNTAEPEENEKSISKVNLGIHTSRYRQ